MEKIVLTGGPSGGKSTAIRHLETYHPEIATGPEVATMLLSGWVPSTYRRTPLVIPLATRTTAGHSINTACTRTLSWTSAQIASTDQQSSTTGDWLTDRILETVLTSSAS